MKSTPESSFVCTADAVTFLLRHANFYKACPAFEPLWQQIKLISEFAKAAKKTKVTCSACDAGKLRGAHRKLLHNFVVIFFHLYDTGKIDQLRRLIVEASRLHEKAFTSVVLSYPGGAAGKKRTLRVELTDGESD